MKVFKRLSCLLVVLAVVFSASLAAAQVEWNHNPESDLGPNFWGQLAFPFATCGAGNPEFVEVGLKQSPVDILTEDTVHGVLPALVFQYHRTPFVVENTGHVIEVPYKPGSSIRIGQDTYELLQFHFHAPSEHLVNGQAADAELHLVHRNNLLDLAVVGIRIKAGHHGNHLIEGILRHAPLTEGAVNLHGFINAKDVLPNSKSYFHYSGSLTTPPCSEGVRWFVLKEPVIVSQTAIDHLHEVISAFPEQEGYPDNNRPVRPLNGRVILSRDDRNHNGRTSDGFHLREKR